VAVQSRCRTSAFGRWQSSIRYVCPAYDWNWPHSAAEVTVSGFGVRPEPVERLQAENWTKGRPCQPGPPPGALGGKTGHTLPR
jgi:hypothetical protein